MKWKVTRMDDKEKAARSYNELIRYCNHGSHCDDCLFSNDECTLKTARAIPGLLGSYNAYRAFAPGDADLEDVMAAIASYYGLQMDEEFTTDETGEDETYKITSDGVYRRVGHGEWHKNYGKSGTFEFYANPKGHVFLHPWKPWQGDLYYFISDTHGNVSHDVFNYLELKSRMNYKVGNYFPTEKLARKHAKEIVEIIKDL